MNIYHQVYSSDEDETLDNSTSPTSPNQPESVVNHLSDGDFVLVRFCNKKTVTHYIGQVMKMYADGDCKVTFLRKTTGGKFIFPDAEDIASVQLKNIIQVLTEVTSHRGIFSFKDLDITLNVK
ncbi:hypothetical protein J6590_004430 [Homalodisca vitripennis]|nr:hypothetical protein J6590_004430 [Homalodisca vitripennis]